MLHATGICAARAASKTRTADSWSYIGMPLMCVMTAPTRSPLGDEGLGVEVWARRIAIERGPGDGEQGTQAGEHRQPVGPPVEGQTDRVDRAFVGDGNDEPDVLALPVG